MIQTSMLRVLSLAISFTLREREKKKSKNACRVLIQAEKLSIRSIPMALCKTLLADFS